MNENNKKYINLSVFLIVVLALIFLCVWLILRIDEDSKDLILAKNDIVTLEAQIVEAKNFNKNYETYKPNFERVDQLFVDPKNPVNLIEFLENTSANSGITSQISMSPLTKTAQKFITLQVSSKGSFFGMMDFSKKIESGSYLIEIENLTIKNSDEKNITADYSSRMVNAIFTIKAFAK
jgi:Tfp pilus assembly protein PilO